MSTYEEVVKKNRETAIKDTLHNLEVLVDNIGMEEVMAKMPGDLFWRMYKYFDLTLGDRD